MRRSGVILAAGAAALAALALPAAASAHAYLTKTVPAASVILNSPPPSVQLTYDEAVEPRLAIISVTDVHAHSVTDGTVTRSPANPDTLIVPLKRVPEGWYLVYWRAISVDGHPVQGAFTFAVGPNPGPAPQFAVPHIAATATSTPLVIAKWLAFLTVMTAIGLFVLRTLIARPLVRRVEGTSLRGVSIAFGIVAALGLVAVPVYLEEATAIDSLRSFFDLGGVVPLWRATASGRGYVDVEICFALFCVAAAVAIWADRPRRESRSIAAMLALSGALAGAAATLALPGAVGHAGQTAPRGLAVLFDWLHLVAGSVWIGGLVGLLVIWATLHRRAARRRPRRLRAAVLERRILLGAAAPRDGSRRLRPPPADARRPLADVVRQGDPRQVGHPPRGDAARLRQPPAHEAGARAPGGRGRIGAAAPEARHGGGRARRRRRPRRGGPVQPRAAAARLRPGGVGARARRPRPGRGDRQERRLHAAGARRPEQGGAVELLRPPADPWRQAGARRRRDADFAMLDMQMPNLEYQLAETSPGIYTRKAPALVMVGHWGLTFNVTPKGGAPFTAVVVDRANG